MAEFGSEHLSVLPPRRLSVGETRSRHRAPLRRLGMVTLALTLMATLFGIAPAQARVASTFTARAYPSVVVTQGARVVVQGRLTPGGSRAYSFQQLFSGVWRTVATGRTISSGYANRYVSTSRSGVAKYRYAGPGTSCCGAQYSNTVTITVRPRSPYRTGTQIIGYSVAHRPITMTVIGSPNAAKRAMFVSAIHGDERGGVQVTRALAASRPPAGLAYFVIQYPNPDGAARNTRKNLRGVDLNRNFPGWIRGTPGSVYYPGTGPLSEPESRVMYKAMNNVKPTLFVTYHQHMNLVDYCGGNKAVQARYARATGMRITQLTRMRGSQATWLHAAYPRTTIMTVELPSYVSAVVVRRHLSAAKYLAAHH